MLKLEYSILYHSCFDFATDQVNITAKMCNFLKRLNQKLKLTVRFVDDMGTIHVSCDIGSSLGAVYGEDACKVVKAE